MISPARISAVSALRRRRKGENAGAFRCENREDSRLAEQIYLGVLQNERFLIYCLQRLIPSGFTRIHPSVMDILLVSSYQILFLDRVPDSAVVHDAVELCGYCHQRYSSGFVNAVLRSLCRDRVKLLNDFTKPAVRYSHPDWLAARLTASFGEGFALEFMASNQKTAPICIQVNTLRCSLAEYLDLLTSRGIRVLNENHDLQSVQLPQAVVTELPGYCEGLFYVQDDAARMSVRLAGIRDGMRVLDVCAAPGGKSIAAALDGGIVTSCDSSGVRLKRCAENYRRLGLECQIRECDAAVYDPEMEQQFDVVIADVPCTGSGIIRKHPEIRSRTEKEMQALCGIQRSILGNVFHYVKSGGILMYSTCSVLPEEDEDQVNQFLKNHAEFSLDALEAEEYSCENGMMRSWTHLNGNDGFFAARMRRLS